MARRRQISEGRAKILFEGPEPGTLVQYFKDDTPAASTQRRIVITGKGVLNNRISEFLMRKLGEIGVPTHFVRRLNMREQLVREVEMIPLQVMVRSVAAGSFARRFGMTEGTVLPRSIVEYYYRSDELKDPMVSEEHITAFGWASPPDLDEMMALALRINDFLTGLFLGAGIRLYDVKVAFGRLWEEDQMRILLADEIGPETCRLNDLRSGRRLDAEACRGDQAALTRVYQELARRLGILPESGPADPRGPETLQ